MKKTSKTSLTSISKRDIKYLSLATKVAEASAMRHKHGAVVVRGNSVLAVGVNKFRNHPDIIEEHKILRCCSIHAEVDALSRTSVPKHATIYVARVNKAGKQMFSRPCNNCYNAIVDAGIDKIIYTLGE